MSYLQTIVAGLQPLPAMGIEWHVGDVVRALRDRKRLTQTQLATKAGVNKATIVSVEAMDRNHGRETYAKIARALGLSMAELYGMVPISRESQRADRPSSATVGDTFSYEGPERRRENVGPPTGVKERRR